MATVRHVTSSSELRKFLAAWFLLNRGYKKVCVARTRSSTFDLRRMLGSCFLHYAMSEYRGRNLRLWLVADTSHTSRRTDVCSPCLSSNPAYWCLRLTDIRDKLLSWMEDREKPRVEIMNDCNYDCSITLTSLPVWENTWFLLQGTHNDFRTMQATKYCYGDQNKGEGMGL